MVQKRRSTAIRKQQIIDAARKLIIRKGSEHLTVRALAKEVGLIEAAIYRHFKSKLEILSFLMTHIMDGMLLEMERTVGNGMESLETVGHALANALGAIDLPGTRITAEILERRSAGIRDLRFGSLVEADWWSRDPDAVAEPRATRVPLLPNVAYVHNNLGVALERTGRGEEAKTAYQQAMDLSPKYVKARLNADRVAKAAQSSDEQVDEPETMSDVPHPMPEQPQP